MPTKEFYLVERVLGEFFIDSGEVTKEHFLLKYDPDVIELHYRFESDKSPKEIIDESIESRVNFPELVDLILAKGGKKRSWDINLFAKADDQFINVGYSRARLSTAYIPKSLFRKNVGIDVLVSILESQLPFKSKLSNSIISALRQARDTNYLEMKLIWSWFALEWYIQSKAKFDNLAGLLDYPQDGSEKYRTALKNILKSKVEGFLVNLEATTNKSEMRARIESDIQELRYRFAQNIFAPPILSYFDDLTSHFEDLLENIELLITDSDSVSFFKNLRKEWMNFKIETRMAKTGRDKFSHTSLKEGTLENIRDIGQLNNVFNFMISIIALLIAALTQSPQIYDGEVGGLALSELTNKLDNLSIRPVLEVNDTVSIEDWTGTFVSEGSVLKEENGFLHIEVKNPSSFLESDGEKTFIPFTPTTGYADYEIIHESFRFICTNESTHVSLTPESQSFSCVFKIWKWYAY